MTSLWTNLRYVSWLVSDTSKGLAQTLFSFAIPLLALIVTNDPAQAGIIGGVGMAIRVTLTLFGGVLADRHRRITLMVLGASIGVALSLAFTLLALGDALTFGSLLVLDALLAARAGLFDTAGESALKDIVTSGTMGRAQAANQARDAALQLAGGPIGGALLVVGGWLVGAVMAACHLLSAITAALIPRLRGPEIVEDAGSDAPAPGSLSLSKGPDTLDASTSSATHEASPDATPPGSLSLPKGPDALHTSTSSATHEAGPDAAPPGSLSLSKGPDTASTSSATQAAGPEGAPGASASSPNALREIREGFAWLFSRPDLRGVLLILTVINLGINTVMTTIIYSLQQAGESPAVIGWISAGLGVMMLAGALLATPIVSRVGAGVLMVIGLVALTLGSAATLFIEQPLWIVAVMAVPGLTLAPLNAAMGGYFMVATPSQMMGRASSASNVFAMGAMPLAPLLAGFGLTWVGRGGTLLIGAGLCAVAAVMAVTNRGLRSLPAESGWAAHAEQFADAATPASVR